MTSHVLGVVVFRWFVRRRPLRMARRRPGRAGWDRREPSIPTATVEEIVRAMLEDKPVDETHWSCRSMTRVHGVRPATVH